MPKIWRKIDKYESPTRYQQVDLPWRELNRKEQINYVLPKLGAGALALTAILQTPRVIGDGGTSISPSEQLVRAKSYLSTGYIGADPIERFKVQYLSPTRIRVPGHIGGSGLRGAMDTSPLTAEAGSNCLANNKVYNEGPVQDGSTIIMRPNVGTAPRLVFDIDTVGNPQPDPSTKLILGAFGCDPSSGDALILKTSTNNGVSWRQQSPLAVDSALA